MPSFPNELVLDVLDVLAHPIFSHDPPLQSSLDALCNCALVCREWTFPAQKRLFRTICFQSPKKPILFRFRSLFATIAPTSPSSKSRLLANSIRSLTILELPTFQDPSMYPMVRLKSSEFASFIVACPNLEHVWVKSGLLQFSKESLGVLRIGTGKSAKVSGRNRITALSIEEERTLHRPPIQDLFTEGIFGNVTRLSWTSFEPMGGAIIYDEMLPGRSRSLTRAPPSKPEFHPNWIMPNKLTNLTLDIRNRSRWLGFLCAMLHSSVESIRELRLTNVPCAAHPIPNPLSGSPTRIAANATSSQSYIMSSVVDVLRIIGPNLRSLSLGSPPNSDADGLYDAADEVSPITHMQPPNYAYDALMLRSLTPNLESLELASYPFVHYIFSISTHNHPATPTLTSRLPHTLKELSLHFYASLSYPPSIYASSLADLRAAVESVSGVERVVLRIPGRMLEKGDVREGLRALKGVCAGRRVRVVVNVLCG